uniref:Uncharacterized protein AlNc14C40G3463 n=1 Tax=Albugo laibachii Nc14 TaxID=890382 RepID=F0W9K8_9STRA|nr:conserved hypothetical protein [Albugo laibachii Nc14]|eukprot:CCA17826.1 conserved hypothetical protein [Albugo laibachii Nc14]
MSLPVGIIVRWPKSFASDAQKKDECHHKLNSPFQSSFTNKNAKFTHCALQEMAYLSAVKQMHAKVHHVLTEANTFSLNRIIGYLNAYQAAIVHTEVFDSGLYPVAVLETGITNTFDHSWVHAMTQKLLLDAFQPVIVLHEQEIAGLVTARGLLEWLLLQFQLDHYGLEREILWLRQQCEHHNITLPKLSWSPRLFAYNCDFGKNEVESKNRKSIQAVISDPKDKEGETAFIRYVCERTAQSVKKETEVYQYWLRDRTVTELLQIFHQEVKFRAVSSKSLMKDRYPALYIRNKLWKRFLRFIISRFEADVEFCDLDTETLILTFTEWTGRLQQWLQATESEALLYSCGIKTRSLSFQLAFTLNFILHRFRRMLQATIQDLNNSDQSKPLEDLEQRRRLMLDLDEKLHTFQFRYGFSPSSDPLSDREKSPQLLVFVFEQAQAIHNRVLDDFVLIWNDFEDNRFPSMTRFGFVLGVSSATASNAHQISGPHLPSALQSLSLDLVTHVEVEVFSLQNFSDCFDRVIEQLFVEMALPVRLSGAVLEWLCDEASNGMIYSMHQLIHRLQLLLFFHFQSTPSSFLGHFQVKSHWHHPLHTSHTSLHPSEALCHAETCEKESWTHVHEAYELATHRRRDKNARDENALFENLMHSIWNLLDENERRLMLQSLQDTCQVTEDQVVGQLQTLQDAHNSWACGWKCFLAVFSRLEVKLPREERFACLKAALDGQLSCTDGIDTFESVGSKSSIWDTTPVLSRLCRTLQNVSFGDLSHLLEDWKLIFQTHSIPVDTSVEEACHLCHYMADLLETTTNASASGQARTIEKTMEHHVRMEVSTLFREHILNVLLLESAYRQRTNLMWRSSALAEHQLEVTHRHIRLRHYDALQHVFKCPTTMNQLSWKTDVAITYQFYAQSPSMHICIDDWHQFFVESLVKMEETSFEAYKSNRELQNLAYERPCTVAQEYAARFFRVLCIFRHLGLLKQNDKALGGKQEQFVEKMVFL